MSQAASNSSHYSSNPLNIQDNPLHRKASASHTLLSDLINSQSPSELHESGIVMSDLISGEEEEDSRLYSRKSSNLQRKKKKKKKKLIPSETNSQNLEGSGEVHVPERGTINLRDLVEKQITISKH